MRPAFDWAVILHIQCIAALAVLAVPVMTVAPSVLVHVVAVRSAVPVYVLLVLLNKILLRYVYLPLIL